MHITITEILSRSEQGRTLPFLCRADDGELYYVKGNYAGRRTMCCEWVAGRLARLVGLPTPEIRIAEVPVPLIQASDRPDAQDLGTGLVFASRLIDDAEELTISSLSRVPEAQQRWVLLFDWWVRNEDRTLTEWGGNPNLVWSASTGGLRVFDFNLAFDETLDEARFWQVHACRASAAGWDLAFQAEAGTMLAEALRHLPEIWQELPLDWLHVDGDAKVEAILQQAEVQASLGCFQSGPEASDTFWKPRT